LSTFYSYTVQNDQYQKSCNVDLLKYWTSPVMMLMWQQKYGFIYHVIQLHP